MKSKPNKTISDIWQAFLRSFRTEEIFWETEKNSNILVAYGMLVMSFFLFIGAIMLQFWDLTFVDSETNCICLLVDLLFFLPFSIYSICVNGNKRWLKYVLLLSIDAGVMFLTITCSYAVLLLVAVPVIVSTRYFSVHLTRATAILTAVLYTVILCASVYMERITEYDMNYCTLPAGTIITIVEDTWLYSSVLAAGINQEMILHTLITYALPVRLLELAVISTICVGVARRGRKMVLKESADAAERASMETELSLASEIQLSALPENFREIRDRMGIDLFASMHPAKDVGGDFYDFFAVDDDHVAIVIADVAGKNIPAALFMMTGKSLIRNCVQENYAPEKAMTAVNAQLYTGNEANLFITAWLGVLEVSTGKLTYVNAGHCRPQLYHKESGRFQPLDVIHGIALACFNDTVYEQSEVQLDSGDAIFLYTDGVTEATNPSGKMYGTERLSAFLDQRKDLTPEELLPELRNSIDTFVGGAQQFDDITMLMLRMPDLK